MFSEIAEIALVAARLGQFLQFLKTRVMLILNFTRPHAITHTNGLLNQSGASKFCRSANQDRVILPSIEGKLRKNALCLNQSAFSNFAPYVINIFIPQFQHMIAHSIYSSVTLSCDNGASYRFDSVQDVPASLQVCQKIKITRHVEMNI